MLDLWCRICLHARKIFHFPFFWMPYAMLECQCAISLYFQIFCLNALTEYMLGCHELIDALFSCFLPGMPCLNALDQDSFIFARFAMPDICFNAMSWISISCMPLDVLCQNTFPCHENFFSSPFCFWLHAMRYQMPGVIMLNSGCDLLCMNFLLTWMSGSTKLMPDPTPWLPDSFLLNCC